MSLTDTTVRNTKPADEPIALFDGGGLFLLVSPTGGNGGASNTVMVAGVSCCPSAPILP